MSLLFVLCLLLAMGSAQVEGQKKKKGVFESTDTNKDGKLTVDEIKKSFDVSKQFLIYQFNESNN